MQKQCRPVCIIKQERVKNLRITGETMKNGTSKEMVMFIYIYIYIYILKNENANSLKMSSKEL